MSADSEPLLQALRAALTPDAYNALEPIINNFGSHIAATENTGISPLELQQTLKAALKSAHLTLPTYSGSRFENVRAFLDLLDDQLKLNHIPKEYWTAAASACLRGNAQVWYIAKKRSHQGQPLGWGDVSEHILRFQKLEMQIPEDQMTFGDRQFYFTKGLPDELAIHIRKPKPKTMSEVYEAARHREQLDVNPHRARQNTVPLTDVHPDSTPSSSNTGPGPMDLDSLEAKPKDKSKETKEQDKLDLDALNGEGLPSYLTFVAKRHGHYQIPADQWHPVTSIFDIGAPDNFLVDDVVKRLKLPVFLIQPKVITGAGRTTINCFTKFVLRVGHIKEEVVAYVLRKGSHGFRYNLLIGHNLMKRFKACPTWDDNSYKITSPRTHSTIIIKPVRVPGRIKNTEVISHSPIPSTVLTHTSQPISVNTAQVHRMALPIINGNWVTIEDEMMLTLEGYNDMDNDMPSLVSVSDSEEDENWEDDEEVDQLMSDVEEDYGKELFSQFVSVEKEDDGPKDKGKGKAKETATEKETVTKKEPPIDDIEDLDFGKRLLMLCKNKFPEIFREKVSIPPVRRWQLEIDTGDHPPTKVSGRPYSPP
ncbi:hypothetical protein K435DRAFT_799465 [Dendrothele bispora CBS 962.96]|uniref:Peptidase A2B Ty3 transposon peptidase domain-containing protein n=1 Tax=Dendrothele bispora (strain CBS 962.96) TaxID=1314807 RepID=A0A4S8LVU0_DENBC|nr:hypothetical protein K435DRAFT_799465 [Dendrothele bispora CBS 962.96]